MDVFKFGVCFAVSFLCVSAQHDHLSHEAHRVNVDVYYESLCPDSRKFFTQQLYPSLQGSLSEFVNLTLVPYGKSSHTPELVFTCHHGPDECYGNKIQACALKLIRDDKNQSPMPTGYNKATVGFINCLMDRVKKEGDKATFPVKECGDLNSVGDQLKQVEDCANGTNSVAGNNYLAYFGGMTQKLQNPLESVPTIVFNNQYNKEDSSLAQTNFAKALCKYIEHDKPAECSGVANLKFSLLVLVIVSVSSRLFY